MLNEQCVSISVAVARIVTKVSTDGIRFEEYFKRILISKNDFLSRGIIGSATVFFQEVMYHITLCRLEDFQRLDSNVSQAWGNELGLGDGTFENEPYLEGSKVATVQFSNHT